MGDLQARASIEYAYPRGPTEAGCYHCKNPDHFLYKCPEKCRQLAEKKIFFTDNIYYIAPGIQAPYGSRGSKSTAQQIE